MPESNRSQTDGTTSYRLRRGLGLKDGPGSAELPLSALGLRRGATLPALSMVPAAAIGKPYYSEPPFNVRLVW